MNNQKSILTERVLKTAIFLIFIFNAGFLVEKVSAQESPLTLANILTGLQTQGKTFETNTLEARNRYIRQRASQRSITFELNDEREKDLREAGADNDLILVLRRLSETKKNLRQKQEAKKYFDKAFLCEKEDNDCKILNFTKAIDSNPNDANLYSWRASIYNSGKRDDKKAILDITKAIELNPKEIRYYSSRAIYYHNTGNHAQSILDLSKAIELDPSNFVFYTRRGDEFQEEEAYERAMADYNKAIEMEPRESESYQGRAYLHKIQGNKEQAIRDYTKAIETQTSVVWKQLYYQWRGDYYYELKNYAQAIEDYTNAIELINYYPALYTLRANAYEKIGEKTKAKADRQKYYELTNKNKNSNSLPR